MTPADYLWTVRYRRHGWKREQVRTYRRKYAAVALVRKLRGRPWQWNHLAHLEYVRLERHLLGPVELVEEWR